MRNEQIHENEQLSVLNTETVQDMFQIRSMHLSKMFLNRSYESLHKFSKVTLKTDSVSLNVRVEPERACASSLHPCRNL